MSLGGWTEGNRGGLVGEDSGRCGRRRDWGWWKVR